MATTTVFKAGIPLAPEVEKMVTAFGGTALGAVIPHEHIEALLGVSRKTSRYRTVVQAFKKRMRRIGKVFEGRYSAGVGLKCLTDDQIVGRIGDELTGARRKVRRAQVDDVLVNETALTPLGQSARSINQRYLVAAVTALQPSRPVTTKRLTSGT